MNTVHISAVLFAGVLVATACGGQPAGDNVLYEEDFSDGESCLDLELLQEDAGRFENGELILEVTGTGRLIWVPCEGLSLDDFTFEMDFYDDTASDGFHFFGLQFRKDPAESGSSQYYLVRLGLSNEYPPVSCAAMASDTSWVGNLTTSLAGDSCWVELAKPFQKGRWHHLEITANGSEITYSIDGNIVTSVNDSRLTEGNIALFAGTNDAENARIKIDNIRVTAPDE